MTRKYELKKRAERQAGTRRRIVEATVGLHTSIGPSQTSIAAIAERAGVQRHTVYAHFPDERSLFTACSSHWAAANPFPDPAPWAHIAEPERRLRTALDEIYRWYEKVEPHLLLFTRDATLVPAYAFVTEQRAADPRPSPSCSPTAFHAAGRCAPRSATRSTSRPGARSFAGRD